MNESLDGAALAQLNERRALLRRMWSLVMVALACESSTLVACGGGGGPSTATSASAGAAAGAAPAPAPAAASVPAGPVLGAHALAFNRDGVSSPSLSTAAMSTRTTGSTLLACVGRGLSSAHRAPADNVGNAFVQLDMAHTYSLWPNSGTALYSCNEARGMAGHAVSVAKPKDTDETTLSVVEIEGGGFVRDVQWREVLSGQPLTSASVTTSGPALLVAWWWGDAGVDLDKTAVPDNGFTVVDAVLDSGALVQCAAAVRQVSVAGTYNLTWASTPPQGAQLWLVAVQAA